MTVQISIERYGIRKLTRELVLPARGLVLVTGANEAGKTSLLCDAPLQALFGAVADRGDPLLESGACVEAGFANVTVRRARMLGRVVTSVQADGAPIDCDTATKATAWVEDRFGPSDLWEGLLTFRWSQASDFTLGKDADRKRFVELLIPGLDRFDVAADRCTKARRSHEATLQAAQARAYHAEQEVARVKAALDAARQRAAQEESAPDLRAKLERATRAALTLRRTVDGLRAELTRVPLDVAAAQQAHREAHQAHARAAQAHASAARGACGACGSQATPEFVLRCEEALNAAIGTLARCAEEARSLTAQFEQHLAFVRDEAQRAEARLAALAQEEAHLRQAVAVAEEREASPYGVEGLTQQLALAQQALGEAQEALTRAAAEQSALELAERAVGPKGARLDLLAATFAELERAAQRSLSQCWPGARLRIERTSQLKDGRVKEESRVLIALPGESGFHPVAALNRGMLRRVDLALRLGRRAILAARSPQGRLAIPYLAIDEALDGIDEEGLTGCAAALLEEAQRSLVVVVSHDERVMRGIAYTQRVSL